MLLKLWSLASKYMFFSAFFNRLFIKHLSSFSPSSFFRVYIVVTFHLSGSKKKLTIVSIIIAELYYFLDTRFNLFYLLMLYDFGLKILIDVNKRMMK